MTKKIEKLAWGFLILGIVILAYLILKSSIDGFGISMKNNTNYEVTGQFGDFVGGVIGTFFALAGTLLIYLSFREQTNENKRNAFESSFFEMMRVYRDNINELRYRKFKEEEHLIYENRQVIREIFEEFIECYREVRKFSNSKNVDDYLTPKYADKLNKIKNKINPKINIIELARIDIAYSIVFYGIGIEGESIIRKNIQKKYNRLYYYKLLYFIKLKPKKSNQGRYFLWQELRDMNLKDLHKLIDELYANRKNPENTEGLSEQAKNFKMHKKYEKYYGGHQFRLGHYFRHLYQSYKYLNNHKDISQKEKYAYGKMYRAQLSTYEQALLFINSISTIGMKWEFMPEKPENPKSSPNLITTYNLIKNLPGEHLYGIRYKTYYKNVDYETDELLK
jgi:hypothetical protein